MSEGGNWRNPTRGDSSRGYSRGFGRGRGRGGYRGNSNRGKSFGSVLHPQSSRVGYKSDGTRSVHYDEIKKLWTDIQTKKLLSGSVDLLNAVLV